MLCVYNYCGYSADLSLYNRTTLCGLLDDELYYKIKIYYTYTDKAHIQPKTPRLHFEGPRSECSKMHYSGLKHKVSIQVPKGNTKAVKDFSLPVLPNRLLKAQTDRHSYTTCTEMGHKVLHMLMSSLLPSFLLSIHDIFLSVLYMRKQNLL